MLSGFSPDPQQSAEVLTNPDSRFFGRQPSATIYPKTNRYRLVFFRPFPPVLARVRGLASRAPPLQTLRFCTHQRLSVRRFLWWPRERARDHFLCWRGFRGGQLWLATPVAVATENRAGTKKTARRRWHIFPCKWLYVLT